MSKNKKITSTKQLQSIVDNLSDLSDLDSDDDAYYQSAPVNSPADDLNLLDKDAIIESRLEKMFGISENEEETTINQKTYSEKSLLSMLNLDEQSTTVTNENMQTEKEENMQREGQENKQIEEEENMQTEEENILERQKEKDKDIENQQCLDDILGGFQVNSIHEHSSRADTQEVYVSERDLEIQTCLDEIRAESSQIHSVQVHIHATNAEPLNHDPITRNRRSNQTVISKPPREWKIEKQIHFIPEFINEIRPVSVYNHKTCPIDIFEKFFPDYLVEILVQQTNIYAVQNNSHQYTPVSGEEIKAYLGILIMMGLNPLPDMELYWSTEPFYNNKEISSVMPIKRFKKIIENLHVNNNAEQPQRDSPEYDKLYKLRPMINELNKVFSEEMHHSSHQSIDECMVKFKGRSSLKQYMPKKPIKRDFKVWARCDSKTGYLYQFEVYTGKGDGVEDEGLGYNVVNKLSTNLPENTLLAFDNFFTGCNILEALYEKKVFAVGTVRSNRRDLPDMMKKNQPKNLKLAKNEFAALTAKPITAIKWLDTRDVTVLTTAHKPTDVMFVKRTQKDGSKKEVLCPKAVADYTLTMGGVDRFDHYRSSYPINRKCRKFWMRLFFFMFDAAIINSYISYSTVHVTHTHSHREFRLRLARELISNFSSKKNRPVVFKNKRGSNFGVPDEIRLLNVGVHLPDEGSTYKRCRFCSTRKEEKRTKILCSTCNVALCAKKCFKLFHTAPPQE